MNPGPFKAKTLDRRPVVVDAAGVRVDGSFVDLSHAQAHARGRTHHWLAMRQRDKELATVLTDALARLPQLATDNVGDRIGWKLVVDIEDARNAVQTVLDDLVSASGDMHS